MLVAGVCCAWLVPVDGAGLVDCCWLAAGWPDWVWLAVDGC